MVTSDDDDDVESVIYYPKNPSCTLYVTLNAKNSKIGRVFDRWQKRETTQNSSHIESARPSVALKHTSSYYYSLSLSRVRASRFRNFEQHQPYFENILLV